MFEKYSFYIEYADGTAQIQSDLTRRQAVRKYNSFVRSMQYDENVVRCGWEEISEPISLSNRLLMMKSQIAT